MQTSSIGEHSIIGDLGFREYAKYGTVQVSTFVTSVSTIFHHSPSWYTYRYVCLRPGMPVWMQTARKSYWIKYELRNVPLDIQLYLVVLKFWTIKEFRLFFLQLRYFSVYTYEVKLDTLSLKEIKSLPSASFSIVDKIACNWANVRASFSLRSGSPLASARCS